MSFRIAVVQPRTHAPPADEANVDDAVRSIERCAGDGADFVCFPESYPGPWRMPAEFDPTGRAGRCRREARRARGVRHHRADQRAGGDRVQPGRHGLSGWARAGALSPHVSQWAVGLHRRHILGVPVCAGRRLSGVRHGARQGRPGDVQRGLRAGGVARAGVARRRAAVPPRRPQQAQALGHLAGPALGARDREPRAGGIDAEHGGGGRPRPGDRRRAGGDHLRKHGGRHRRGRCQPGSRARVARRAATAADRRRNMEPSRASCPSNGSART